MLVTHSFSGFAIQRARPVIKVPFWMKVLAQGAAVCGHGELEPCASDTGRLRLSILLQYGQQGESSAALDGRGLVREEVDDVEVDETKEVTTRSLKT